MIQFIGFFNVHEPGIDIQRCFDIGRGASVGVIFTFYHTPDIIMNCKNVDFVCYAISLEIPVRFG